METINEVVKEKFEVRDFKGAICCMEKKADLNREIEKKSSVILEEIALLEEKIKKNREWLMHETEEIESKKMYFNSLLVQYYREEKEKNPKFKLSTPYGKVYSKKTKKWNYENEEDLKEYLGINDPEVLKVKVDINKTELKKKYPQGINKETGEILPGINIEEQENFIIDIAKL